MTYTEPLHDSRIAQAHVCIREHILALIWLVRSLTSRLVIDANDHQTLARDGIDKVLAADLDWVDSIRNGGEERGQQRERAKWLSCVSHRYATHESL